MHPTAGRQTMKAQVQQPHIAKTLKTLNPKSLKATKSHRLPGDDSSNTREANNEGTSATTTHCQKIKIKLLDYHLCSFKEIF
jgi:hypothetical protein